MTFDYTSMGFYTFDALCRPVTDIPPGGGTYFVDEFTIAVSGAAGSAAIVAAKHGLSVQAVGGVGEDLMGDWVLRRLADFGIDTANMQRCPDHTTSSSVVTTRPDGARPALHKRGARVAVCDLDGEGDPIALAEARTISFGHRSKLFLASTPTVKGLSRIEREYEASDQRRFFVP